MATSGISLTKEERTHLEHRLASYLRSEREEPWGDLAVRLLADYITEQIGPVFFNQGIDAAQRVANDLFERFEVNLDAAKRLPPTRPAGER
jgi:uncharacterized protein (DUF2164 family)